MPEPSEVEVTVQSVKGKCNFGHEVGDKIYFDGKKIRGDICYNALTVALPKVYALRYGAQFPWGDVVVDACPDPENPVVFEMRRVRKQFR